MLRRLNLRTKCGLLVIVAIVAILGIGVPAIRPRLHAWRATASDGDRIRTATSLSDLLRRIQREANLSAWFLASGESETHAALAEQRPLTDRAARVATEHHGRDGSDQHLRAAIDEVGARWSALRTDRARIDRRLLGDDDAARRFDDATIAVVRALDATALLTTPTGHGSIADDLRSLADLAALERATGVEQETLTRVIARARITGDLTRRIQLAVAEQSARRSAPALESDGADERAARSGLTRAAAPVVELRAPALRGRVPFQTTSTWARASDQQLDAIQDIGRALETSATRRASAYRDAAWNALLRFLALLIGILIAVLGIGVLMDRAIRKSDIDVDATNTEPGRGPERLVDVGAETLLRDADLLPTTSSGRTRDRVRHEVRAPSPIAPAVTTVPNALPRRIPVPTDPDVTVPLPTAPARGPGAVFELIARFEAGRRRADAVTTRSPDEVETTATSVTDTGAPHRDPEL